MFGLEHMNMGAFDVCHKDEKAAFIGKLCRLSQLTWDQIQSSAREKMGFEWLPQSAIRVPLPSGITEEVRIMVFRYNGMKAMLGFRVGHYYYPFWLDTNFSAYHHSE